MISLFSLKYIYFLLAAGDAKSIDLKLTGMLPSGSVWSSRFESVGKSVINSRFRTANGFKPTEDGLCEAKGSVRVCFVKIFLWALY